MGKAGRMVMMGEFAGVGCLDRCSSSSGIGLGIGILMFLQLLEIEPRSSVGYTFSPTSPVTVDSGLVLFGPIVDALEPVDESESATEPDKEVYSSDWVG